MPRNIQTFLPDGTLEGIRIIELSESNVKAFVIPRIKFNTLKDRLELNQPALYLLISSGENQLYIGESENFLHRAKTHDQSKDFWDIAIAIVSNTNALEKSDVKYLESLAAEKAKTSAAMEVLNKTTPKRNNVHEFKIHTLEKFLEDTALIAELLGYSIFSTKQDETHNVWYCKSKKTNAKAEFRGDKFIVLSGSIIDKTVSPSFEKNYGPANIERVVKLAENAQEQDDVFVLQKNLTFRSPNHAGGFVTGRSINAWTAWKNTDGKTMDEVMRTEKVKS